MKKMITLIMLLCVFTGAVFAAPVFENNSDGKQECEEYVANGNGDLYTPSARYKGFGTNHQKSDTQKTIRELIEAKGHNAPAVCLNAQVVGGRKWVAVSSEMLVWVSSEGNIRAMVECDNPVYEIHLMKRKVVRQEREEVMRPEQPRVQTEVIIITQVPQVTQVQITPVPVAIAPVMTPSVPVPMPAQRPRIAYEHMLVIPVIPYIYQRPAPMFYGNTGGCCASQLPPPVYHNPGFTGGTNPMR